MIFELLLAVKYSSSYGIALVFRITALNNVLIVCSGHAVA
jgi:hypothetical protein